VVSIVVLALSLYYIGNFLGQLSYTGHNIRIV